MPSLKRPQLVDDPASFDFEQFITGVHTAEVYAPLYRRGDLAGRIEQLAADIKREEARLAGDPEQSVADESPLAALVEEHNALVRTFEESRVDFRFRGTNYKDREAAIEQMRADGAPFVKVTVPGPDGDVESDEPDPETLAVYLTARLCTSHPLTPQQVQRLRETIGEAAFTPLWVAWRRASGEIAGVTAPFSQLPSPTREPAE